MSPTFKQLLALLDVNYMSMHFPNLYGAVLWFDFSDICSYKQASAKKKKKKRKRKSQWKKKKKKKQNKSENQKTNKQTNKQKRKQNK